jgi:glutamate--cysteine ligase
MDNYMEKKNLELLEQYFRDGCKLNCIQKLGVEIEHFIVHRDGSSVSYYEDRGTESLLQELAPLYPRRHTENGRLLGLSNNDYSISLEPAGQLEISIVPKESICVIQKIYRTFLRQLHPLLKERGFRLITLGYQPVSSADSLPLIPKKRYAYMDRYFQSSGTSGRNMMRGTASTQVSIDYCCEEDFCRKYRAAYLLMPALKLFSDNTPVFEGRPSQGFLERTRIWNHVDPARCGIFPGLFRPDFGFRSYAEYLWNLPLIFRPSADGPVYTGSAAVRELWRDRLLSPDDVEHILSMTFLDVRLKNYVEIRGADSMPLACVTAYLALIKGLFFSPRVLEHLLDLLPREEAAITAAEESLSVKGYAGMLYGRPADEFLWMLLDLAEEHLESGEAMCLLPFRQNLQRHTTIAKEYYGKHTQTISEEH